MTADHLLDTSVATRIASAPIRAELRSLMPGVSRTRMTDLVVGFSARSAAEWEGAAAALAIFPIVEFQPADFARALEVQRQLAALGLRGRKVPDLVIAAVAERTNRTVLHYDKDFAIISEEVTGQPHRWVVPGGSVD